MGRGKARKIGTPGNVEVLLPWVRAVDRARRTNPAIPPFKHIALQLQPGARLEWHLSCILEMHSIVYASNINFPLTSEELEREARIPTSHTREVSTQTILTGQCGCVIDEVNDTLENAPSASGGSDPTGEMYGSPPKSFPSSGSGRPSADSECSGVAATTSAKDGKKRRH